MPALPADRRRALATEENPAPALDYLVEIGGRVSERSFSIHLRYIPDKLLLAPRSFDAYLSGLSRQTDDRPETAALTIADDVNNEVVPRWVQVEVTAGGSGAVPAQAGHRVVVEDRQPNWDNPLLMARLPRL